jgi:hypothetical protein
MQIADRCAPRKIANGADNLVLQTLHFQKMGACYKFPGGEGTSRNWSNECFMED